MFNKPIYTQALRDTERLPENLKRVYGDDFLIRNGVRDSTSTTVLRMVADRFERGARLYWVPLSPFGSYDDNPVFSDLPVENTVKLVMFDGSKADWLELVEYKDTHKNRTLMKRMDEFTPYARYAKGFGLDAFCFRCTSDDSSVVFIRDCDLPNMHFVLSTIPSLFSKAFGDTKLSEFETKLFKSLTEKTSTAFELLVDEFIATHDFEKIYTEKALADFEKKTVMAKLDSSRRLYLRQQEVINEHERTLGKLYRTLEEMQINILGLEEKINSEETASGEFAKFFTSNKRLHLMYVGDDQANLTFRVDTYLNNFNVDMYEKFRENSNSFINKYLFKNNRDDMLWLLDKIFIDGDIRVKMQCVFFADFENRSWFVNHESMYYQPNMYLRNPHLEYYNCFGDNGRYINDAINKHDYEYALTQFIASTGSLNLAETINLNRFLQDLENSKGAVLEWKSGVHTLDETLKMHEGGLI